MTTCKIVIVTHRDLFEEFYKVDSSFDPNLFLIFNVSSGYIRSALGMEVLNKCDLPGFVHLGKQWAESEVIYNVLRNGYVAESDYLGFLHYDYKLYDGFCADIKGRLGGSSFVSFSTFGFRQDFEQRILLDPSRPEDLQGDGLNCYYPLLDSYNSFFLKEVSIESLWERRINLCCSFLIRKDLLVELSSFFQHVVDSGMLDGYDTLRRHRIQGGMMERFVGVWSAMRDFTELEVHHFYNYEGKL